VRLDKKILKLKKKIDKLSRKLTRLEGQKILFDSVNKCYSESFSKTLWDQTPLLKCNIFEPLPAFHGGKTIQFFTYKEGESDGTVE
jgi:hypothetical protein